MKRVIFWFKTDLRLHDNEALVKAISNSDEIIPVFCFDERHFQKTLFGFQKTGSFRAQFLLEALADLDQNLRKLGSGLMIVSGIPEIEIPKIATTNNVYKVFAKREVAYEEKQTEKLMETALFKLRCEFETVSTSTLYHAEDLPFAIKEIPDIFTNFRKRIEKETAVRPTFEKPQSIKSPSIPTLILPDLQHFGFNSLSVDSRAAIQFKGGETAALQRIQHYFYQTQSLSNYKTTRNGMIGLDYSSKFSAWLSMGCLSSREIYSEVKKYEVEFGANESTYWLIFELLWRDYFRFMMKKHANKFFQQTGIKDKEAFSIQHHDGKLQSWIDGTTGNDFIDANMTELKLTGFISNRGRQNVASYFCNDLKLDWRYGAAYFEQQLVDYDVCSNWGNWAYLAGVGNDPRGVRAFNIDKQAQDYDKNGDYRALWLNKSRS